MKVWGRAAVVPVGVMAACGGVVIELTLVELSEGMKYGICGHISENEYYSPSRKAINAIIEAKGTDLRKGVDDALSTSAFNHPINHVIMKAAYYTISGVAANLKLDWILNLDKVGFDDQREQLTFLPL